MRDLPLSREDLHAIVDAYWQRKVNVLSERGAWYRLMEQWREDKLRTDAQLPQDDGDTTDVNEPE